MQKWEYLYVKVIGWFSIESITGPSGYNTDDLGSTIFEVAQNVGEAGWELVDVTLYPTDLDVHQAIHCFKRSKQ
jgi:hypothetical protein